MSRKDDAERQSQTPPDTSRMNDDLAKNVSGSFGKRASKRPRPTAGGRYSARKKNPEKLKAVQASYGPECLPSDAWRAGQRAIVAAALAADPANDEALAVLLTVLCRFMAACRTWDQRSAPDVAALLTDEAIDSFLQSDAARSLAHQTLRHYRITLRRIARAIGSLPDPPPCGPKRGREPKVSAAFFSPLADLGPLTTLVAAYEQTGHRLHRWGLQEAARLDLRRILAGDTQVIAPPSDSATYRRTMAAATQLREAPDVPGETVPPRARPKPPESRQPKRTGKNSAGPKADKRMGRHAAMKAARAKLAEEEGSNTQGKRVVAPPPLDEDLEAAIAVWRPKGLADAEWDPICETTRVLVKAYRPGGRTWLSSQAGHLARFCRAVHQRAERDVGTSPLRPVELLDEGLVDWYISGPLGSAPDASRATARAVLRRAVRSLAGNPPLRLAYTPVQPPYTPMECAEIVALARHQPTPGRRRSLGAIVALGLGAGLDHKEQGPISPRHIVEVEHGDGERGLAVDVPGTRARLVVVRAPYDELLREALAIHSQQRRGRARPLYGDKPTRRHVTSKPLENGVTAVGKGVDINVARLRSTWLVACMSAPVPLDALLYAAGLRSARTLCDLLPYCPKPDPAEVARILHTLEERKASAEKPEAVPQVGTSET